MQHCTAEEDEEIVSQVKLFTSFYFHHSLCLGNCLITSLQGFHSVCINFHFLLFVERDSLFLLLWCKERSNKCNRCIVVYSLECDNSIPVMHCIANFG
ncbi:Protein of unknown function [Gryllus bimaculatus]|nr:Protein of unknown function [Gryllus bimaculatus]